MLHRMEITVTVEINFMIWKKNVFIRENFIMQEQMFWSKCYHAGTIVIMWEQMLSCGNNY